MACLPQLSSVPAAYGVVAGGCDWPLPSAVALSNNDVSALRASRHFRQLRYVSYVACVGWKPNLKAIEYRNFVPLFHTQQESCS